MNELTVTQKGSSAGENAKGWREKKKKRGQKKRKVSRGFRKWRCCPPCWRKLELLFIIETRGLGLG